MKGILNRLFHPYARQWQFIDGNTGREILAFNAYLSETINSKGKTVNEAVEQGSFATVNKTEDPLSLTVTIGISGTNTQLHQALSALTLLKTSATTFSLVTPRYEYRNLTLVSFDTGLKEKESAGNLVATLTLSEVREVVPAYQTVKLPKDKVKNKEAASRINNGQKQTQKINGLPAKTTGK